MSIMVHITELLQMPYAIQREMIALYLKSPEPPHIDPNPLPLPAQP